MSFFKIFFIFTAITNIALILLFAYIANTIAVLNLESAFIGSLIVVFSAYYGYKRVIKSKLLKNNEEDVEKDEDDDEEELVQNKLSFVTQSYKGFLFPMRLAAYGVFIASFLYLASSGTLQIAAFLAGLTIIPISVLLSMVWLKITSQKPIDA